MRSWRVMALLVTTQLPACDNKDKTPEIGGIKQKETDCEKKIDKEKPQQFHVDFKFSMEQQNKDGDVIVGGKTIPGRILHQIGGTLDSSDGKQFPLGGLTSDENASFDIKVTSLGNGAIRLAVFAKKSRTESLEAGESRSWNLNLEATKTVKLGEKIKLEFGDEKTIGTKCTFEALIEEKVQEKK